MLITEETLYSGRISKHESHGGDEVAFASHVLAGVHLR